MKILVTGGAGFIGSAVVRLAVSRGHEVVNLDALTYAANLENVAPVAQSALYAFEQADIRNRAALDRVFAKHQPDAVMHLAAESHVDRSIDGPGAFIETNVTGTYNLLEAARAYWTKQGKPGGFRFPKGAGQTRVVRRVAQNPGNQGEVRAVPAPRLGKGSVQADVGARGRLTEEEMGHQPQAASTRRVGTARADHDRANHVEEGHGGSVEG